MAAGPVQRWFSVTDVPEMLYGAVVAASVLAVVSVHAPTGDRVVVITVVVALVYWLAHVYVDAVGGRFVDRDHSTGARVLHALNDNWAVLIGATPPILVLLVARAFGADGETAAWVALWVTGGLLVAVGGIAAWRAGARGWPLVGEILVGGCFGVLVVGLKYALH